jgi:uncharacterized protein with FMN-binding domain
VCALKKDFSVGFRISHHSAFHLSFAVSILLSALLVAVLLLSGCSIRKDIYTPGTYEGVSEGYHGPIRVLVTTDAHQVSGIEIIEEHEKLVLGEVVDIVYETIPERVIRKNSTDVDVVSGATYTSTALIEAIGDGLNKARLEPLEDQDTGK